MLNMGSPFEIFNQLVDQAVDGHFGAELLVEEG